MVFRARCSKRSDKKNLVLPRAFVSLSLLFCTPAFSFSFKDASNAPVIYSIQNTIPPVEVKQFIQRNISQPRKRKGKQAGKTSIPVAWPVEKLLAENEWTAEKLLTMDPVVSDNGVPQIANIQENKKEEVFNPKNLLEGSLPSLPFEIVSESVTSSEITILPVKEGEMVAKKQVEKADSVFVYHNPNFSEHFPEAEVVAKSKLGIVAARVVTPSLKSLGLEPEKKSLNISYLNGEILISNRDFVLRKSGEEIDVVFDQSEEKDSLKENAQIFVRNTQVVNWDKNTSKLISTEAGETEVFVIYKNKMEILKIEVSGTHTNRELVASEIPSSNYTLDSFVDHPSFYTSAASMKKERSFSLEQARAANQNSLKYRGKMDSADSVKVARENTDATYSDLKVQVVDDRSTDSTTEIYPISGVEIFFPGTNYVLTTDARGLAGDLKIPEDSRFIAKLHDPSGYYKDSTVEIFSSREEDFGVFQFKLMRKAMYKNFLNLAKVQNQEGRGSVCGILEDSTELVAGVSLSLDEEADGPFYFNDIGYLDTSLKTTSANGKFCFFNIPEGPALLTLKREDLSVGEEAVKIFASEHSELQLNLRNKSKIRTFALAETDKNSALKNSEMRQFEQVENVEFLPLGNEDSLLNTAGSLYESGKELSFFSKKTNYLVNSPEFEQVLYTFDLIRDPLKSSELSHMTPLFQRGYIEDLALQEGVVLDSLYGNCIVDYGHMEGQVDYEAKITLMSASGEIMEGVTLDKQQEKNRKLFMNLSPGVYQVIVWTQDDFWLSGNTVTVYSDTTSYVSTGSSFRYNE